MKMATLLAKEFPNCLECKTKPFSNFSILSNDDLYDISIHKSCTLYKKGQVVYYEGEYPSGIYCIHYGKIKIHKIGYNGKAQIVRFAQTGEFMGYQMLLNNVRHSATATALEDSMVCFLSKLNFTKILHKYPKLSENLLNRLGRLLIEAEEKIISLAQKPVRERLAETLIILNKVYSTEYDLNRNCKSITLSREELADIVGTATETVIRLLSDFREEKLISTQGRKIFLNDIVTLRKIAKLDY